MPQSTANLTVRDGCTDYNVTVDFSYSPGEPMVRYYPDGSGYPGSPPEFDCVESFEINEFERAIDGNVCNEDPDNWEYTDFDDVVGPRRDCIEADVRAALDSGDYDEVIMENADDSDFDYYAGEDDYV